MPQPTLDNELSSSFAASFLSSSPVARESLARDLAECSDDDMAANNDLDYYAGRRADHGARPIHHAHSPALYSQPSPIALSAGRSTHRPHDAPSPVLSALDQQRSRSQEEADEHERSHNEDGEEKKARGGVLGSWYCKLFMNAKVPRSPPSPPQACDEDGMVATLIVPTEATALLAGEGPPGVGIDEQWEAAVAAGQIGTTWQREAKTIAIYSRSLIITFLLQYSINVASVFTVGHIGKVELGAINLATMTANITCYAPIQGLTTALDTLCGQAYGSGNKHLVGLQVQRMAYFLLLLLIPVAVLWLCAEDILASLVPDRRAAELAGLYLYILIAGTPAFVLFEVGKRFVQAQGLFVVTTYVLLTAAPINVFLNWFLVWHSGLGYIGAPIAVVITYNLLPLFLIFFIWRMDASECWTGFSWRALHNWGPMIRLAIPGMVMVVAEWCAFEVLTLASGQFGSSYLAAQSVLVTLGSTTFQLPFPLSIAGSTRVANLIGAGLVDAAKVSAKVTFFGGCIIGLFNMTLMASLRYQIPFLFTQDQDVIDLVVSTIPVCAIMQIFDGISAVSHGLMRSIGRQEIGGWVNLGAYYLVALPISFGSAFGLGWKLNGLWVGVTVGLFLVALIEYLFLLHTDWHRAVQQAQWRNAAG